MATLTLENIPDTLYDQLKEAAKRHGRSISSEVLYCVERMINPPESVAEHLAMARQLRAKTAHFLLTDEEINQAKSEGRA